MARPKRGQKRISKQTVSMRMPSAIKVAVLELARAGHRTFTDQVLMAIVEHLQKNKGFPNRREGSGD
jgi:hypothetical protein